MVPSPAPDEKTTAALLARALGGPVRLVAFDGQGLLARPHPGLPGDLVLSPAQRAELAEGRRTELPAGTARYSALAAQGEDGLLWVALRPLPDAGLTLPRFAQHLAHAARNSLSSIKLAVQAIVRSDKLGPRELKRIQIAEREITRMERMLSTASEMARMPARTREVIDLAVLLEAALLATREEIEARGVLVHKEIAATVKPIVGDPRRLQLALENLLVLGARAMPEGGGELHLALQRVDAGQTLSVRDHGADVPAAERETLFEPLASGSRAAGLDLALVAEVARELGGEALAEDAGPGLRVILRLPDREEGVDGHVAAGR
jgi:signal transduction histidine kinase